MKRVLYLQDKATMILTSFKKDFHEMEQNDFISESGFSRKNGIRWLYDAAAWRSDDHVYYVGIERTEAEGYYCLCVFMGVFKINKTNVQLVQCWSKDGIKQDELTTSVQRMLKRANVTITQTEIDNMPRIDINDRVEMFRRMHVRHEIDTKELAFIKGWCA